MTEPQELLTVEIKRLSSALKRLEERLKAEPAPDPVVLNDFRHSVDNVRLTAWSVSELMNAERIKKNPNTVLAFLSAERLRRFNQLVKNLCGDMDRRSITLETTGMQSLRESVDELQERLRQAARQRTPA